MTTINLNFCKMLGISPKYTDFSTTALSQIKSLSTRFKRWEFNGGYSYVMHLTNGISVSIIKYFQTLGSKNDEWEISYGLNSNWYRRGWMNEADVINLCQKLSSL